MVYYLNLVTPKIAHVIKTKENNMCNFEIYDNEILESNDEEILKNDGDKLFKQIINSMSNTIKKLVETNQKLIEDNQKLRTNNIYLTEDNGNLNKALDKVRKDLKETYREKNDLKVLNKWLKNNGKFNHNYVIFNKKADKNPFNFRVEKLGKGND
jgi:hypothetical protein